MKYIDALCKSAEDKTEDKHTLRNAGLGAAGTALMGAGIYSLKPAGATLKGLRDLAKQKDKLVWVTQNRQPWAVFDDIGEIPIGGKRSVSTAREAYSKARQAYERAFKNLSNRAGERYATVNPPYRELADMENAAKRFGITYAPYKEQARALIKAHPRMLKLFKFLKLR